MSNIDKRALNQAELESALLELKRISEQPAVSTHYARVLRQHIANMGHRIAELDKRLIEYAGIATREARRVAEPEARTVTVKLYDDFQLCHYGTTEDYAKGYIDSQNNFTKWLSAAGIKVKES